MRSFRNRVIEKKNWISRVYHGSVGGPSLIIAVVKETLNYLTCNGEIDGCQMQQ
jgi:hypothetical protein